MRLYSVRPSELEGAVKKNNRTWGATVSRDFFFGSQFGKNFLANTALTDLEIMQARLGKRAELDHKFNLLEVAQRLHVRVG
jgi:hypothetical protein